MIYYSELYAVNEVLSGTSESKHSHKFVRTRLGLTLPKISFWTKSYSMLLSKEIKVLCRRDSVSQLVFNIFCFCGKKIKIWRERWGQMNGKHKYQLGFIDTFFLLSWLLNNILHCWLTLWGKQLFYAQCCRVMTLIVHPTPRFLCCILLFALHSSTSLLTPGVRTAIFLDLGPQNDAVSSGTVAEGPAAHSLL